VQRGSPESKPVDEVGTESDEEQKVGSDAAADSPKWAAVGGLRSAVYSRSLALLMGLLSWLLGGAVHRRLGRVQPTAGAMGKEELSWGGYATSPDFWSRTLQNWQSEFLAVGSMAAFTIYLRQRGSPESKPVGAPHDETASSG